MDYSNNNNVHSSGTGYVGLIMILGFLTMLSLVSGIILVAASTGRGRIAGFYMIVLAILLAIAGLLFYSSTRTDLW